MTLQEIEYQLAMTESCLKPLLAAKHLLTEELIRITQVADDYQSLRNWIGTLKYGTLTIEQLRAIKEIVDGNDVSSRTA